MSPAFFKAFPAIAPLLLTAAALHAEPADELIAKGDVYYINLQAAEALKYYLPAERLEPNNVRLLVRISRKSRTANSYRTLPTKKRFRASRRRSNSILTASCTTSNLDESTCRWDEPMMREIL